MHHHMLAILQLMMGSLLPYEWFSSSLPPHGVDPIRVALRSVQKKPKASTTVPSSSIHLDSAPVIGILAQPRFSNVTMTEQQYVAASYVKWLEAGGARAIPIPYDTQSTQLLDDLFLQMNGLFLPGGDATLPWAVQYLLQKAVASNQPASEQGYFPVWGTCLGYEFLLRFFGGDGVVQSGFNATNVSLPLFIDPIHDMPHSRLYHDPHMYRSVTQQALAMNNHHQGIEPQTLLATKNLSERFYITSTNVDGNGRPFVSTIEPRDPEHFPFYGVQYHPEKNAFEYATYPDTNIPYEAIDHSAAAISFSLSTAQFFVQLVRQGQRRNSVHAYTRVEQFPVLTTYPVETGIKYEQVYILPNASFYESYYDNHTAVHD